MRESAATDLLASAIDVPATVIDLAGIDTEGIAMDGRSLVPVMFTDDESSFEWRESLLIEQAPANQADESWRAMRVDDALYVSHEGGFVEYYDLANDPYQLANIAQETDELLLDEYGARLRLMASSECETLRAVEASG